MYRSSFPLIRLFLIICIVVVSVSGCGMQAEKKTISTITNELYTCPNAAFSEAHKKEESAIISDPGVAIAVTAQNSPTMKYLSSVYQPLFSNSGYESFMANVYAYKYQISSIEKGWSSKVLTTDITLVSISTFNFICTIAVTNADGTVDEQKVSGTFEFDDNNTVRWFKEYNSFLAE